MTTLLVASTGGHLTELHHLRPRLHGVDEDVVWVTFDTPQSRSLLADERVVLVDYTATRDYRHVATNLRTAARILRNREFRAVVSTGAGIALSFLPVARARGLSCHYIESAARSGGPSTTGRLLSHVHGMRLYTQYEGWAGGPWRYRGSVFDGFSARPVEPPVTIRRVVVTLGAHPLYGFRRLVERLIEILPEDAEVLWQTGVTDVSGLPIAARPSVPSKELAEAMRDADLVVSHAGIGSALGALEAGRSPVLVPRIAAFGEHVDDHQSEIAADLTRRDIAIVRPVEELTPADMTAAAGRTVLRAADPPLLQLDA